MADIDLTKRKHTAVTKDQQFEAGDVVTFVFLNANDEIKDMNINNLLGLIHKVEGRYVTMSFSQEPIVNGEIRLLKMDRSMVVKMNGYSKVSLVGENGVTTMEIPLADVLNIGVSIIFKNMLERESNENI